MTDIDLKRMADRINNIKKEISHHRKCIKKLNDEKKDVENRIYKICGINQEEVNEIQEISYYLQDGKILKFKPKKKPQRMTKKQKEEKLASFLSELGISNSEELATTFTDRLKPNQYERKIVL